MKIIFSSGNMSPFIETKSFDELISLCPPACCLETTAFDDSQSTLSSDLHICPHSQGTICCLIASVSLLFPFLSLCSQQPSPSHLLLHPFSWFFLYMNIKHKKRKESLFLFLQTQTLKAHTPKRLLAGKNDAEEELPTTYSCSCCSILCFTSYQLRR